jgi:D-serine deaminase-like pyridoxal phosphate-dependent protein
MAAAGLGDDLLIANEVVDPRRLAALAALPGDVRITVAVDSDATLAAAAAAGLRECVIDVDVGLPRCGCPPLDAGRLADEARGQGLHVRGVMGYEGHLMMVEDRSAQRAQVETAMALLRAAHDDVGGDVVSAGGTGTYDLHDRTGITELQAGSYALMDSHYARLGLPFEQALAVAGTVIAAKEGYAVADVGLKALGMDHGNPSIDGATVWFCSDEHVTFAPGDRRPAIGERVLVTPAHVDPTMALHERAWLVRGEEVLAQWAIDLRGWG